TDVPASYTELSRGATSRALAAHRIDDRAARELLDALAPPPASHPDDPQEPR
ncbi:oxidoreductase, partial [Isoptericola sp. QY 916]|nr:oxidoreductase [Isoptericola sp. QY 916]